MSLIFAECEHIKSGDKKDMNFAENVGFRKVLFRGPASHVAIHMHRIGRTRTPYGVPPLPIVPP